jgi:hypothetical protein
VHLTSDKRVIEHQIIFGRGLRFFGLAADDCSDREHQKGEGEDGKSVGIHGLADGWFHVAIVSVGPAF